MRSHMLSLLCLLLLGSITVVYPQAPPKPNVPSRFEIRQDPVDHVATSASGRLRISASNDGVLEIEPDRSLKGPLFIWVETQMGPVIQKDDDQEGATVLPLPRVDSHPASVA